MRGANSQVGLRMLLGESGLDRFHRKLEAVATVCRKKCIAPNWNTRVSPVSKACPPRPA